MIRFLIKRSVLISFLLCSLIVFAPGNNTAWGSDRGDDFHAAISCGTSSSMTDGDCVKCLQPKCLSGFVEVDLVSDLPIAEILDPNLVNPWGLVFTPKGVIWTADNGPGLSTSYSEEGDILPGKIMIPAPGGGSGTPTGMVINNTDEFEVKHDKPARFIWATEDGTIVAWNPQVSLIEGVIVADESKKGAVYKGIALGRIEDDDFIFATDFHNGHIDVFDHRFRKVGRFTDPDPSLVSQNFAPFGIRNFNGLLYVTYAKQLLPDRHDDQAGPGNGFVDIFSTEGKLLRRLISHGPLNSPWGLEISPATPCRNYPVLFVGNFGDGKINTFALPKGNFLGPVKNKSGSPVVIDGLWSIVFRCVKVQDTTSCENELRLYFAAGINDEADGLMGYLYQP